MTDIAPPISPLTLSSSAERMFPTLTPAQIKRIAAHGVLRSIRPGEVLIEAGARVVPFFVVTAGRVEVVRPSGKGETLVTIHEPGQFTGEVNMLSGRRALVQSRAIESGEVIELNREQLLALVQTDSELSEILMRAFILRRVELIAHGLGDVVLVGSNHCAGTLRVKEFLTRNGHPYSYIDLDRDADVQELLDRFHVTAGGRAGADLPRRSGAAQPDQPGDRRMPRLQRAPSTRPTCAMWSSSAPDRRGSRPPCTARRKDSTCWCWNRTRPADRPARARRSRTTSAFRPASRVRSSPGAPTRRRRSSARR